MQKIYMFVFSIPKKMYKCACTYFANGLNSAIRQFRNEYSDKNLILWSVEELVY
jgi:hypothetical protein